MKYAKNINGMRLPFPGVIVKDGKLIRDPSEEEILAAGYSPVEDSELMQMKRPQTVAPNFDASKPMRSMMEKYLPSDIQRVGGDVILKSSTEGSTKKFKLTVDDSGELHAIEVTE